MMKNVFVLLALWTGVVFGATPPEVTNVKLTQPGAGVVVVTYDLSADAVITLDIVTNSPAGWVSIGAENIQSVSGDCNRKVAGGTSRSIRWDAYRSWPEHKIPEAKAVVTAWALNDTPDYLVVDINQGTASAERVRYYTSSNALPGGLSSHEYRTSAIVMRKIYAKDVRWTMGQNNEPSLMAPETAHTAMLTNNYYIGVFELTQGQWANIMTPLEVGVNQTAEQYAKDKQGRPSHWGDADNWRLLPVETVSWNQIWTSDTKVYGEETYVWPAGPAPDSFLGHLRARVDGLADFRLPSEGEWEYACRAGTGEGYWNNGLPITDDTTCPNLPGNYKNNGGEASGPLPVGSFTPNAWGLYDMHGNVQEWVIDWSHASADVWADITQLAGAVYKLEGNAYPRHIYKGGCHGERAITSRSAFRGYNGAQGRSQYCGFRVVCQMELD